MPAVRTGVSRSVHLSTGPSKGRGNPTRKIINQTGLRAENDAASSQFSLNVSGLDNDSRRLITEHRGGRPYSQLDDDIHILCDKDASHSDDWEDLPEDLQNRESFQYALRDIVGSRWRTYKDNRTWRQRTQRLDVNWEPLLPTMVSAYLKWKYPTLPAASPLLNDPSLSFDITTVNVYSLETVICITRSSDSTSPSEALVLRGYLGNTPLNPSIAVSINTLELYRRLRMRKPSFSVEAFAKVLCDLYATPYRPRFRTVLGDTFDVYLAMLRNVDKQVQEALHRNTPNWRVLNACPPCTYKLEDEPPQPFNRIIAFDGNNSMKRMFQLGEHRIRDQRPFTDSDYLLPPEYVDGFSDEVTSRKGPSVPTRDGEDWLDETAAEDVASAGCTSNFKAAASDETKKMWGIFEECGIFVSACRHGLIMWFSDMIRSGELAKYPLAHISKALDILEDKLLFGSDIGCSLQKTVTASSLGTEFKRKNCRCCINAFHGYAHNWVCQKENHPNVIKGLGLEDLETLERIFSASNAVAAVTRYSTAYRRRVFIDMFFHQWDDEKYLNLGTMLYNNYRQALGIVEGETLALHHTLQSLGVTEADLEKWEYEEVSYFSTLGQEPQWDLHAVTYVELLQELRKAESEYSTRNDTFLNCTPVNYQFIPASSSAPSTAYSSDLSQTRKAETRRRVAAERRNDLLVDVVSMEVKMGIATRWQPSDLPYVETVKYMVERKYHRALDHLQKLVIQRLFELNKLNLSGTGYRMRRHIAKSLQTRCKAIQNAVKNYNIAALEMVPPRPTLDWSTASHYSFLEDFEMLRNTRQDIQGLPWAQPVIRAAMKQAQRIKRAHEEIYNCNIEIRRLLTYIIDENADLKDISLDLKTHNHPITGAVDEFILRRQRVNASLLSRIQVIHDLVGFSGNKTVGTRLGRIDGLTRALDDWGFGGQASDEEEEDMDYLDEDEEARGEYGGLVDFVSELPLRS